MFRKEPVDPYEKSLSATSGLLAGFSVAETESAVALDTGAAANLVCPEWLGNHNSHLQKMGIP